jgi:hypothetical protein
MWGWILRAILLPVFAFGIWLTLHGQDIGIAIMCAVVPVGAILESERVRRFASRFVRTS